MILRLIVFGFLATVAMASPASAWERMGYGCAAGMMACPSHLTPAQAQIILGFATQKDALEYWNARFGAPGGKRGIVMPGTYNPLSTTYQHIHFRHTCTPQSQFRPLPPPSEVSVANGVLFLGQTPQFRYDVTESDFLLITGLCGPKVEHNGMSLADWLGPSVVFASDEPPDKIGDHSGYKLLAPNGRMAIIFAAEHSVIPISAGGTVEGWVVTVLEHSSGGTGRTAEVGAGASLQPGGAPVADAGQGLPLPPSLLPPLQVAERFWSGADPCNALRRIADALDLVGQGALLPDRPEPNASPRRCTQIYDDLRRRLSGADPVDEGALRPVFLWTLTPEASAHQTAPKGLWSP